METPDGEAFAAFNRVRASWARLINSPLVGGVFTQSTTTADLQQIYNDIGQSLASIQRLDELTVWAVLAAVISMLTGAGLLALSELRQSGRKSAAMFGS